MLAGYYLIWAPPAVVAGVVCGVVAMVLLGPQSRAWVARGLRLLAVGYLGLLALLLVLPTGGVDGLQAVAFVVIAAGHELLGQAIRKWER